MNLVELNDCLNPHAFCESDLASRISKILEDCAFSKNIMICFYLIEKDQFLYCNRAVKNILGKCRINLFASAWTFWCSRIDSKEAMWIRERLTNYFNNSNIPEKLTLRYHFYNFKGKRICLKHEVVTHKIKNETLAINYLFDISDKEKIESYFEALKNIDEPYHSIVEHLQISTREREVLELIANGSSSKEIAARLFISNHTVISHRKNLIVKFQVKNTAHLIKKAARFISM